MKSLASIVFLLLPVFSYAQQPSYFEEWSEKQMDSLRSVWRSTTNDSIRMDVSRSLGLYFEETNRDSSMLYRSEQLRLARRLKQPIWTADALNGVGYTHKNLFDFPKAMENLMEGLKIAEKDQSEVNLWHPSRLAPDGSPHTARMNVLGMLNLDLAGLYRVLRNDASANTYIKAALTIAQEIHNDGLLSNVHSNMVGYYRRVNKLDSALFHAKLGYESSKTTAFKDLLGYAPGVLAEVYMLMGDHSNARKYLFESITRYHEINHLGEGLARAHVDLANLYRELGKVDSCMLHARISIGILQTTAAADRLAAAYTILSDVYETQGKYDSAYKYQRLAMVETNKTFDLTKLSQVQEINLNEHMRLRTLEEEKVATQNKIRIYSLLGGGGVLLLVGILLYRNNRQKHQAYQILQEKNNKIEQTLSDLKATQAQLVQSEKMASLGELTAGIAHEIQNPLNFVNNFSEVSSELIKEMKSELATGNLQPATDLADNIDQNLDKILHHGKRADTIVKSMMQHSRGSSGQKQETDINQLCDEYLKLAYHGYRAKDKSFNAEFKTEFDATLPKINVIPQDIGRAVLNLINNAFYACTDRARSARVETHNDASSPQDIYKPLVSVSTHNLGDKVEINVKDNGPGVPDNIKEKIFQPFFTTKPTGQGTGLGLSLSYDIIKAHGGELRMITKKEGKGSEFVIQLPI